VQLLQGCQAVQRSRQLPAVSHGACGARCVQWRRAHAPATQAAVCQQPVLTCRGTRTRAG
jgi:hypothetical protein